MRCPYCDRRNIKTRIVGFDKGTAGFDRGLELVKKYGDKGDVECIEYASDVRLFASEHLRSNFVVGSLGYACSHYQGLNHIECYLDSPPWEPNGCVLSIELDVKFVGNAAGHKEWLKEVEELSNLVTEEEKGEDEGQGHPHGGDEGEILDRRHVADSQGEKSRDGRCGSEETGLVHLSYRFEHRLLWLQAGPGVGKIVGEDVNGVGEGQGHYQGRNDGGDVVQRRAYDGYETHSAGEAEGYVDEREHRDPQIPEDGEQ